MEDRLSELDPTIPRAGSIPGHKLPRGFYTRDTIQVARDLLGTHIVKVTGRTRLIARIVEVEAYPGEGDPASHSYRGETGRNSVMFGKGGHLNVYFTYGMHFCINVVTGIKGEGSAVLIRAVEPVRGRARMLKNRGMEREPSVRRILTGGPARICQAFGLTMKDNGTDLTGSDIFLLGGGRVPDSVVSISTRIGISTAKGKKWRFFLHGNPYVSR